LYEPLACLVTCPMEDMAWFLLKFAKDHSLAMTNRSWAASGTRTAFGRSKAEHRSGQHFESEAAARSAQFARGENVFRDGFGEGRTPPTGFVQRARNGISALLKRILPSQRRSRAQTGVREGWSCATRTAQPYRTRRNRQFRRGHLEHRNRRIARIFMGELRRPCHPSARPIYAGPAAAGYGMMQKHRCSGRSLSRAPRHAGRR
jgi:hypothetical protein